MSNDQFFRYEDEDGKLRFINFDHVRNVYPNPDGSMACFFNLNEWVDIPYLYAGQFIIYLERRSVNAPYKRKEKPKTTLWQDIVLAWKSAV